MKRELWDSARGIECWFEEEKKNLGNMDEKLNNVL